MPPRKVILATGEVYHVMGRGVARSLIFRRKEDYQRIFKVINYYRYVNPPLRFSFFRRLPLKKKETSLKKLRESKRLVEIIAFCLMPNHFHLLLKQLQKKGTSTFMRNFQNSYARYFNTKYHRSGALFQALFKAVRIETDAQLLHVSRYIHLNLVSSFLVEIKNLENYPWSSFPEYMKSRSLEFVDPDLVLKQFKTEKDYKKFVFDQADYQRKLQEIKHLTLEKR
jgi:putative transposase